MMHESRPCRSVTLVLLVASSLLVGCPAEEEDFSTAVCQAMSAADTIEVTAVDEVHFNDEMFVTKDLDAARVNVIVGLSDAVSTFVEAAVNEPSTGMLFAATAGVVGGWRREAEPAELADATPYDACSSEIPEHWLLGEMDTMVDYHVEFSPTEEDEVRLLLVSIAQ